MRRNRTVSVSGRLRSVSVMYDKGQITQEMKDKIKVRRFSLVVIFQDFVLVQDPVVEKAFEEYENGNEQSLLGIDRILFRCVDLVNSNYFDKESDFSFLDSCFLNLTLDDVCSIFIISLVGDQTDSVRIRPDESRISVHGI